jgi:environmental stress-induced protein Ves
MRIEHFKASELTSNKWSGGTTTQLAIYPKDADYKKRNFLFRLSTATVESDESIFTKLPGVSRKLMILDGEIKIEHKDRYTKTLKKFEQDEFSGDWETKSHGKATDFNLMTTGSVNGEIEAFTVNNSKYISLSENVDCYGFYIYSGVVKLSINDKSFELEKGDIIMFFPEDSETDLEILPTTQSELIKSEIKFSN